MDGQKALMLSFMMELNGVILTKTDMVIMLREMMLMAVFLLQVIHSMTGLAAVIQMEMAGQTQIHHTLLKMVRTHSLQMRLSGLTAMLMVMVMKNLVMKQMIVRMFLEPQWSIG